MGTGLNRRFGKKGKNKAGKWIVRILLFILGWGVIFFFLLGPGRVLFPSLLISYSSVTDKTNTVYYSGEDIEQALDVLWMASVVQDSIRKFWNDSTTKEFWRGVHIFLCESSGQYYHLTWNRAMGSALMGRVVLNPGSYGPGMSLYSGLVHEMSHLYMSRRFGYLSYVFLLPKWFDEGCASMIQEYSYPENHLDTYLKETPTLVPLTSLKHPWNWEAMEGMDQGMMSTKGYGHLRSFMGDLMTQYGMDKIRSYAGELSCNFRPNKVFRDIFGISLADADQQWLENQKKTGSLPTETTFVSLSFDFSIFLKWLIIFAVIAFPVILILRWLIRL
ncbi:MAG: hypothetical protein V1733_07520 [bacterium]